MSLETLDLGREDYQATWTRQKAAVDEIADGGDERLFVVEHGHVITLGRGTDAANLLTDQLPVVEIERGGDATYHGPGQLVAYPLLRLRDHGLGIHSYLRLLESTLIDTCRAFGVETVAVPKKTGVWTADGRRKIASIGIAVRRGVSFHGIALNVSTDLTMFEHIRPCGFDASIMTSLERETGRPIELGEAAAAFRTAFGRALDSVAAKAPA